VYTSETLNEERKNVNASSNPQLDSNFLEAPGLAPIFVNASQIAFTSEHVILSFAFIDPSTAEKAKSRAKGKGSVSVDVTPVVRIVVDLEMAHTISEILKNTIKVVPTVVKE
jgi:hypothetical protein